MANNEHLKILQQGVEIWNNWRKVNRRLVPNLSEANLSGMDLSGADLTNADLLSANLSNINLNNANLFDAHLGGAELSEADLSEAELSNADLSDVNLTRAHLNKANLINAELRDAILLSANFKNANLVNANLNKANLSKANLFDARLSGANLSKANLSRANLSKAYLSEARLSRANLIDANLCNANLSNADISNADLSNVDLSRATLIDTHFKNTNLYGASLHGARMGWTVFARVDLSGVFGLDEVVHIGPSTIGTDTIQKSRGRIPEVFLRRCGMSPWEIEAVRLHDTDLSKDSITEILNVSILRQLIESGSFIGGVFIYYDHADLDFAKKLYQNLDEAGASVWLDGQDVFDADMQKRAERTIRTRDVVMIVLSANSVESGWVKNELEISRKKEKHSSVLSFVAIDDSWKMKSDSSILWQQMKQKSVLDFSEWQTEKFDAQIERLVGSLSINH